jgi:hypothetical protein
MLLEEMKLKFKLINAAPIAFDYSWNLSTIRENTFKISIPNEEKRVEHDSSKMCFLNILAMEKLSLRNYCFSLKVIISIVFK